VQLDIIRRAIPILVFSSIFTYILAFNNSLTRFDGILLLIGFVGYNVLYYFLAKQEHDAQLDHPHDRDDTSIPREIIRLLAGIVLLVIGADRLVLGATSIALSLGVSELVIGVTMVAFGTSLPELATSIVASWQKQSDIIIGNIIGSNIANLLLILGATSVIRPIAIQQSVIEFEFIIMLAFTLLVFPFALNRVLSRKESSAFIIAYLVFVIWVFI
jgi:cation:H+ antiporter